MSEEKTGLGVGPYKVPTSLYAGTRGKLFDRFAAIDASAFEFEGPAAIVLEGGKDMLRYDTDHEMLFRQESNFYYLFGANEPNLYGALDLNTRESILFVPRHGVDYEMWCGKVLSHEAYKAKYGVDVVHYTDEVSEVLAKRGIKTVHTLYGKNSDSGNFAEPASFKGKEDFQEDKAHLHREIIECRVIKTEAELEVMRYITGISSEAHIKVMQQIAAGMYEFQLEGIFQAHCHMEAGSRYAAYTCICGSGKNGATLHYGHAGAPNDKKIGPDDMLLLDMGAEYQGYCSDITCSFPSSGKFSEGQKQIYQGVYDAQQAVYKLAKPGVNWADCHRAAERAILENLVKHGFVKAEGKTIEELHALHIPAIFMPHGLGHFIGLDTHDVGGYPDGVERVDAPGIRNLRTTRVLQRNMTITVEPGCYFIDALIERALKDESVAPHLNMEKIDQFRDFGGIRLEDDVIITEDGIENMTKCPRTIEEVEAAMASK